MKDTSKPDKRRKYDAAFRAEALRLAEQSRSTQAAAWGAQHRPQVYLPVAESGLHAGGGGIGAALDPATAAELRQLRAANR